MNPLQKKTAAAIVNIFESGRICGDYSAIAVLKGDAGHLSYGRSQVSLGSGNLFKLLNLYCGQSGAQFATALQPYLPRFARRDTSLDVDTALHDLLAKAGMQDPIMRFTQDSFFDTNFFPPATSTAELAGITLPLGVTIVYDSMVQGGWAKVRALVPGKPGTDEKAWLKNYVKQRRSWLSQGNPAVRPTTYRMDAFQGLIDRATWDLALPFPVHGVTLTEAALNRQIPPLEGASLRVLELTTPYLRGPDVVKLQEALDTHGLPNSKDGIYGPFTDALVRKWQAREVIKEDGAGLQTRKSLGMSA